jgi:prepilin-type N-terminal cleavage/methylation domain-containing protein
MIRDDARDPGARLRSGFTLIELMLVVTMLSVVMYLTLDSLRSQQKTSIVTEQIVEVGRVPRETAELLDAIAGHRARFGQVASAGAFGDRPGLEPRDAEEADRQHDHRDHHLDQRQALRPSIPFVIHDVQTPLSSSIPHDVQAPAFAFQVCTRTPPRGESVIAKSRFAVQR